MPDDTTAGAPGELGGPLTCLPPWFAYYDEDGFILGAFDFPDYVRIEGTGSCGRVFARLLGRINAQANGE